MPPHRPSPLNLSQTVPSNFLSSPRIPLSPHSAGVPSITRKPSSSVTSKSNTTEPDSYAIQVCLRVRPPNQAELARGETNVWNYNKDNALIWLSQDAVNSAFQFDYLCPPVESTQTLYSNFIQPMITHACNGFNTTIFAYGQTSSGKTHTILGSPPPSSSPGLLLLSLAEIFTCIAANPERDWQLRVSALEIYNEKINDLLTGDKGLEVRERSDDDPQYYQDMNNQKRRDVCVVGLKEEYISSPADFISLLIRSEKKRATAETDKNERSSRSHSVFRIFIDSKLKKDAVEMDANGRRRKQKLRSSILTFVDLAGSECVSHLRRNLERQKECRHINRSLLGLGRVVCKLAERNSAQQKLTRLEQRSRLRTESVSDLMSQTLQRTYTSGIETPVSAVEPQARKSTLNVPTLRAQAAQHIPFRDSVLTYLLSSSLGGNARTAFVCTISPVANEREESINTMRVGGWCRGVDNVCMVNEKKGRLRGEAEDSDDDYPDEPVSNRKKKSHAQLVQELRDQNARLLEQLETQRSSDKLKGGMILDPEKAALWREFLENRDNLLKRMGVSQGVGYDTPESERIRHTLVEFLIMGIWVDKYDSILSTGKTSEMLDNSAEPSVINKNTTLEEKQNEYSVENSKEKEVNSSDEVSRQRIRVRLDPETKEIYWIEKKHATFTKQKWVKQLFSKDSEQRIKIGDVQELLLGTGKHRLDAIQNHKEYLSQKEKQKTKTKKLTELKSVFSRTSANDPTINEKAEEETKAKDVAASLAAAENRRKDELIEWEESLRSLSLKLTSSATLSLPTTSTEDNSPSAESSSSYVDFICEDNDSFVLFTEGLRAFTNDTVFMRELRQYSLPAK